MASEIGGTEEAYPDPDDWEQLADADVALVDVEPRIQIAGQTQLDLGGVLADPEPDALPRWLPDGPVIQHHLAGLADLAEKTATSALKRSTSSVQTVVFFDLTGSTSIKVAAGNRIGTEAAVTFLNFVARLVTINGGQVVKLLGDGVLCTFDDPVVACVVAMNVRQGAHDELNVRSTAGLTIGPTVAVPLDRRWDVMGDTVDRAARIEAFARPGQILIDTSLREQVRSALLELGVTVGPARHVEAKGIDHLSVHEITLESHWKPLGHLAAPFEILRARPSHDEKREFMRDARHEIIEIGIGLTSFANYFAGEASDRFRDPLREQVRRGVDVRCYGLDPDYEPGVTWEAEQGNPDYPSEAAIARRILEKESRFCEDEHYRGVFEYRTYRRVPEFWCLGVDVDDPVDGRMFFAPYLMGVPRSDTPVARVSRQSDPRLFDRYMVSVDAVRAATVPHGRRRRSGD